MGGKNQYVKKFALNFSWTQNSSKKHGQYLQFNLTEISQKVPVRLTYHMHNLARFVRILLIHLKPIFNEYIVENSALW